ncbi:HAD family hydrolase [Promicromonospora kroppenstedtii]|uniref:HAD family hydrolase n=1 Tax=Promicromonospora kroppenstedtii TaxID=440482 RepID=UPI001FE138B4|nr:HAD family hydrolase [Promicromonospora kroppenstedtii]
MTPRNETTDIVSRRMVALDIDGTLLGRDGRVPTGTVAALDLARAAGHEVVLATGRSLVGLSPVATQLGLIDGFAVCSNGALTVRLDQAVASGYVIQRAQQFDPAPAVRRALDLAPGVRIGVEDVGWGWQVSEPFEPELLNGEQKHVPVVDLCRMPATRIALHAPGISQHVEDLAATGVTVTPGGQDWLDLTAPGTGKAPALERLRTQLGIGPAATVAVGDGHNDLGMLTWARRGVAMGQASDEVRQAADEVTGTIDQHGAITVLRSLLPRDIHTDALSPLAGQLAVAAHTSSGLMALRVWHEDRSEISRCDTWVLRDGVWVRHGPIPSATGATMRAIELAAAEAGLAFPRGDVGRRRAHWRSVHDGGGRTGFELPLHERLEALTSTAAHDFPH